MALKTLGTNATTTLHALQTQGGTPTGSQSQAGNLTVADAATLRANIWDDTNALSGTIWPGGFEFQGGQAILHVPNRGVLKVLPGDWIAYDANGWPILLSYASISGKFNSTSWTHS